MRNGHIIKECPTRLKNRRAQAFQAAVVNHQIPGSTSTTTVTLEMVQQMIIIAFSTLGLQGQGNSVSSSWIVDFGASNHMTGLSDLLCNLREYSGTQNIQIANGSNLPITTIGDIGPSFPHVFVSPRLSANLIYIGQMVDNNWDVHLSRNGCLVQDQVSGKVIVRGPKVGRLFLLQFTILRALSLASVIVENKAADWHNDWAIQIMLFCLI